MAGPPSTMSAAPASNGVFVVIPPSNASGLRPPPAILPTSMCQPPGVLQFEEPLGVQTPRAIQLPDLQPMETFLTEEPKALGTVQILIGRIHLGCGSGSALLLAHHGHGHAGMLFTEGCDPFWGGACFVISGSLSVAAEKSHSSCLVRGSLGMNVLSALAASAGTAFLLMDFGVTSWVCCQTPPEWEYSEDVRATSGGGESSPRSSPPTVGVKPPTLKPARGSQGRGGPGRKSWNFSPRRNAASVSRDFPAQPVKHGLQYPQPRSLSTACL
ncbi:Membrane-spanning 4-domains subfamily A member 15 [Vulpes lagopus]